MKRGYLEPRTIVNDELTKNEEKVLYAWFSPENAGNPNNVSKMAKATGLTTRTVVRHLGTLEKWLDDKAEQREREEETDEL